MYGVCVCVGVCEGVCVCVGRGGGVCVCVCWCVSVASDVLKCSVPVVPILEAPSSTPHNSRLYFPWLVLGVFALFWTFLLLFLFVWWFSVVVFGGVGVGLSAIEWCHSHFCFIKVIG